MKFEPILIFDGDCSDAIAFYVEVFNGKQVKVQTYGDNKDHLHKEHLTVTPNWKDKVMFASITLPDDGSKIICRDIWENESYIDGNSFATALEFSETEEMDKIYHKLAEGGQINVPIQKKFWHAMYAEITDKFNKKWVLNCQIVSILDD